MTKEIPTTNPEYLAGGNHLVIRVSGLFRHYGLVISHFPPRFLGFVPINLVSCHLSPVTLK
jgi:hypothetical protein